MPWIQTHLTVDKSQAPLIELLLENLGALSITLGDAGDEPMLEPPPGATPLWQATRVTGLFSGDTDVDTLRSQFSQALQQDLCKQLQIEVLDDQDWERSWLDQFKPMRFGEKLWICPSGHKVEASDAVVVNLDPGLAFGTGTHPTTALCLQWLDQAELSEKTVIDFGCGSGVLAIAALKLGAARVIGIDHDPQALIASTDNAQRNGVADRLNVYLNEDAPRVQGDLVLANILANVLIDLTATITELLGKDSELVLSGILQEQAGSVAQSYASTLDFSPPQQQDGWVLLHGSKHSQ